MTEAHNVTTHQSADLKQPETTRNSAYFAPRVDIFETESELQLHADLPGVAPGAIDLRFENGELILQAKVSPRPRQGHQLMREYEAGDFYRVFQVHESIDSGRIEAENKQGVLIVHLPKEAKAKPKQVAVKVEK